MGGAKTGSAPRCDRFETTLKADSVGNGTVYTMVRENDANASHAVGIMSNQVVNDITFPASRLTMLCEVSSRRGTTTF